MRPRVANHVCHLARTPLVDGCLVWHRSGQRTMMVGSTPRRLPEILRLLGLPASMACGDDLPTHGRVTQPRLGDGRPWSGCNRPNLPNTLRTAPAQHCEGQVLPTPMGATQCSSQCQSDLPRSAECRMHTARCLRHGLVRIGQSCRGPLNEACSWPELMHSAAREAKRSGDP